MANEDVEIASEAIEGSRNSTRPWSLHRKTNKHVDGTVEDTPVEDGAATTQVGTTRSR